MWKIQKNTECYDSDVDAETRFAHRSGYCYTNITLKNNYWPP